jgi:hypothetical protein
MNLEDYKQYWHIIIGIVDEFRRNPDMILDEEDFKSDIANTFYASTVEFLKNEVLQIPPEWVFKKKYYLKTPWFANDYKSAELRILIMIETPVEFKSRNIYIEKHMFSRC